LFYEDLGNLMSRTEESAPSERRFEMRRGALLAASDIEQLAKALGRVSRSVAGFLHSCGMTELKGIKRQSAVLRAHCDRLNLLLREE